MHSRGRCTIMGALLRSLGGVRHPLRASVAQIVQKLTLTIPRANGGTTASNRAHLLTGIIRSHAFLTLISVLSFWTILGGLHRQLGSVVSIISESYSRELFFHCWFLPLAPMGCVANLEILELDRYLIRITLVCFYKMSCLSLP